MQDSFSAAYLAQEKLFAADLNASLNGTVETDKTTTGTNKATAYAVTKLITVFTTVEPGTGAVLPAYPAAAKGFAGIITNRGANELLLYPSSGTINGASSQPIPALSSAWVMINGAGVIFVDIQVSPSFPPVRQPYDMLSYFDGAPPSGLVLWSVIMVRAVTFPVGLVGSFAECGTAPTGSVQMVIERNGSSIGSINFAGSATAGTFTFPSQVVTAPGDTLTVLAPNPQDLNFSQISWSLVGSRAGGV